VKIIIRLSNHARVLKISISFNVAVETIIILRKTMEPKREIVRCHTCNNVQRDWRAYRDHLLRAHGEVAPRGSDIPVLLEGRELEVVWATAQDEWAGTCRSPQGGIRAPSGVG